nr:hypothetical protein BaRGS_017451 [Batillaria attramentaria]
MRACVRTLFLYVRTNNHDNQNNNNSYYYYYYYYHHHYYYDCYYYYRHLASSVSTLERWTSNARVLRDIIASKYGYRVFFLSIITNANIIIIIVVVVVIVIIIIMEWGGSKFYHFLSSSSHRSYFAAVFQNVEDWRRPGQTNVFSTTEADSRQGEAGEEEEEGEAGEEEADVSDEEGEDEASVATATERRSRKTSRLASGVTDGSLSGKKKVSIATLRHSVTIDTGGTRIYTDDTTNDEDDEAEEDEEREGQEGEEGRAERLKRAWKGKSPMETYWCRDVSGKSRSTESAETSESRKSRLENIPFAGKRRDVLYKPPAAFKPVKKNRRITVAKDPFSTDRQYDLPKGGSFTIKKGERKATQFVNVKRGDDGWKAPKKFELKEGDRKTTQFWTPKLKSGDKGKGRRGHGDDDDGQGRGRRRKLPESEDSGLDSDLRSASTRGKGDGGADQGVQVH